MQCSTPIIEPCVPCKHPLEYLFENAYLATLGLENKVSFTEAFLSILNEGLYIPKCNICCPDCSGLYILSGAETFLLYSEFSPPDIECCLNFIGSTETSLQFNESLQNNKPEICCNTEFNNCFNKLYCWFNKPEALSGTSPIDTGIVEYGAFYDKCDDKLISGLCYINEFFKKYCDLNLGTYRFEFINLLLELGIVVRCIDDYVIIGSVSRYIQYVEAVG